METPREQEGAFQTYKNLILAHYSFTCLMYSHRKTELQAPGTDYVYYLLFQKHAHEFSLQTELNHGKL